MRRVIVSLIAALVISALALPVAARVEGGCGKGQGFHLFEVGVTANAAAFRARYPTVDAGITAGAYTEADLAAQLEGADRNNDGWLCVKDVYAWSTGKSGNANAQNQGFSFFVHAVDNVAAP